MRHQMRFTVEKIAQRIRLLAPLVYRQITPIPPFQLIYLSDDKIPANLNALSPDATWQTILPGQYWGPIQRSFVMCSTFTAPLEYAGGAALHLPIGSAEDFVHPEALIYIDGEPLAAVDRAHQEIALPSRLCDGREHRLILHGWTGYSNHQGHDALLLMRQPSVVQIDQALRNFLVTAHAALELAQRYSEDNPIHSALLNGLDETFLILDTRDPLSDHVYPTVAEAHAHLKKRLADAGSPLPVYVWSAGHAHIDVAWLWTLEQTRRKTSRTWYTALHLMDQFPDYTYTQSQPQLYEYIRQDHPELFTRVQQAVHARRWELIGGMWVEADCNLSGSESLARQFLLGRRFFRQHFGPDQDSPVLWLPDVFGYSAQLPQLIRLAGMQYFFTIKIGWSQYNKLPYDSFWWQGLDGSRVITHFSTTPESDNPLYASTYNAAALPIDPLRTWQRFKQKDIQRDLLMVYGWGDGGGGPTREMLENIRETANFPGSPQTKHAFAGDFFKHLETAYGNQLPTWDGELYLEYHRGTYTTQSRNKRANRKAEIALHNAEFLCAYAKVLQPNFSYPREAFTEAWRLVCLNQFHDIIPGSSIGPVYAESLQQYGRVMFIAQQAENAALEVLRQHLKEGAFVNPSPVEQRGLPPYSVGMPTAEPDAPAKITIGEQYTLENERLLAVFNAAGDLVRLYDKANEREVLPTGAIGNQFQAFEDRPQMWDAWDIDIFYQDRMWLADSASSITRDGDALTIQRQIMSSPYTQRIRLDGDMLRFDTEIDWRERHVLLKVAFPVEVLSSMATYDVQWGYVQRPTHWNTSWDWARFEVVGHKWADLSEGGYGVSLLNDCKYGYDIRGHVMRLSLLKSPTWPDSTADVGKHYFSYALYPHAGSDLRATQARGYAFNNPAFALNDCEGMQSLLPSLVSVKGSALIETIKLAEDDDSVIVRLYEPNRVRGKVTLRPAFSVSKAEVVNLIEDTLGSIPVNQDGSLTLLLTPFQIMTVKLYR
jgi:alpha-mannosidase